MVIDFEENQVEGLSLKVRAAMGVPEELLTDEVISSPIFLIKASKYINKKIKDYDGLDETFIEIAYVYYICYLLCPGMPARLPKQMENVNTKTVLQTIDWEAKALEMLDKAEDIINDAIEEVLDDEELDYGTTYATLSDEMSYPNTTI